MPRDPEAYTLDHLEDTPLLSHDQRRHAAETFLAQLRHRDETIAHELAHMATHPEETGAAWQAHDRFQAEHAYDTLRRSLDTLHGPARDYTAEETAKTITGDLADKAEFNRRQPASHLIDSPEEPDFPVSFDPAGYDRLMAHLQSDLTLQADAAFQGISNGLLHSDRNDFLQGLAALTHFNANVQALHAGTHPSITSFQHRDNRQHYYAAYEERAGDLLQEYRQSIQADFPSLWDPAQPDAAQALLSHAALQDKFRWFADSYQLLPLDRHALAHAIHQAATTEAAAQAEGSLSRFEQAKLSRSLEPHRRALLT